MNELNHPKDTKWVVSHNGNDIYIGSVVYPENCFVTGQPYMEIFDSKEEANTAFPEVSATFIFNEEN